MAWKPSPKVKVLKDTVDKFGGNKAVMMLIDERKGTFEVITYGKTKKDCEEAKSLQACCEVALEDYYDFEGMK